MGHFVAAVRVTVRYSDTFADPRGCHSKPVVTISDNQCTVHTGYSAIGYSAKLDKEPNIALFFDPIC